MLVKNSSEIQKFINKELNNINIWFKINKLNNNVSKTYWLLMGINKTSKEIIIMYDYMGWI